MKGWDEKAEAKDNEIDSEAPESLTPIADYCDANYASWFTTTETAEARAAAESIPFTSSPRFAWFSILAIRLPPHGV